MSTENNIKLCDVMCENEIVIHLVRFFALFFVFFVLDHLLRGAQVQFLLRLTLIRDSLCLLPTLTYSVFLKLTLPFITPDYPIYYSSLVFITRFE